MDVFSFKDYRELLKFKIAESSSIRGYQSKLASAAGCQTSYLSRVLSFKVHLTPEHAAGLCKYWSFDMEESQFFLQLVHLGRAGTENLRRTIQQTIDSIRAKNREIDAAVKLPSIKALHDQALYYSKWHYAAVHMLILVESLNSVAKIADRLKSAPEKISRILSDLENMGLIARDGKWFKPTQTKIHLARSSPLLASHIGNWYLRAIDDVGDRNENSLHYAAVHSLSRTDIEVIRSLITDFIKSIQTKVNQSKEEDVVCFSCSFFRI